MSDEDDVMGGIPPLSMEEFLGSEPPPEVQVLREAEAKGGVSPEDILPMIEAARSATAARMGNRATGFLNRLLSALAELGPYLGATPLVVTKVTSIEYEDEEKTIPKGKPMVYLGVIVAGNMNNEDVRMFTQYVKAFSAEIQEPGSRLTLRRGTILDDPPKEEDAS